MMSSRSLRAASASLVLLATGLFSTQAAAQSCPAVAFYCGCDQSSHLDLAYSTSCTASDGKVSEYGYDRMAGTIHYKNACIGLDDDFVVGCLPAGTPVTLTLRVQASLHVEAPQGFNVEFFVDGVSTGILIEVTRYDSGLPPFDWSGTQDATLNVVAGTPFRLDASGGTAGLSGSSTCDVIYSLLQISPPGCLSSCAGYGTTPTAASATSWGRLKLLYR